MKKLKTTILLWTLIGISGFFDSCVYCGGELNMTVRTKNIRSTASIYKNKNLIDIDPKELFRTEFDSIVIDGRIEYDTIEISQIDVHFNNFNFMTAAYACDPPPDRITTQNKIIDLDIFTLYKLEGVANVGESINNYLTVYSHYYHNSFEIDSFVSYVLNDSYSDNFFTQEMELTLDKKLIEVADTIQFKIECLLDNGEKIESITNPITIK
jgi:hypothetical protein